MVRSGAEDDRVLTVTCVGRRCEGRKVMSAHASLVTQPQLGWDRATVGR